MDEEVSPINDRQKIFQTARQMLVTTVSNSKNENMKGTPDRAIMVLDDESAEDF
jgi:hypothetical protein